MKLAHPELRSALAAEYALGLMTGRARRRFEAMLARDAELREQLTFWHERLAEIPAQLTPVAPRERVWTALAREVLVVRSPGPALADPSEFAWRRLRKGLRMRPLGPAFDGVA